MLISRTVKKRLFLSLLAGLLASAGPTAANAQWCGENGLIRFSFDSGDSLVSVIDREPENGVILVDLYAWLTDVIPVARDGEAFMATGGFEFTLVVEGAEAFVLEKNIPIKCLDMGSTNESCIVGLDPGLSIRNGRVHLVHWKIMFQGKPQDVVFKLDPEPGHSCKTVEGCVECRSPGLYIGVEHSGMLTSFFGVGSEPAFLNPTTEPDFTPTRGKHTFEDVGLFKRR